MSWRSVGLTLALLAALWVAVPLTALEPSTALQQSQDPPAAQATAAQEKDAKQDKAKPDKQEEGLTRLSPDHDVWIDTKNKRVLVDGEICLRRGPLEMFACPMGTKEHESIIRVNAQAFHVHAGLLAIGARQGHPVRFDPEYTPAKGMEIEVFVQWDDSGMTRRVRAQQWVRHLETGKTMEFPWVFAGSGFWVDEETGTRHYLAEAGDLICVSNFPTATLDLPVESSALNGGLLFDAFTEKIPPLGTKVRLILKPKFEEKPSDKADKDSDSDQGTDKKSTGSGGHPVSKTPSA